MECVICYEQYTHTTDAATLSCRHTFHSKCIAEWRTIKQTCPLCRCSLSQTMPTGRPPPIITEGLPEPPRIRRHRHMVGFNLDSPVSLS